MSSQATQDDHNNYHSHIKLTRVQQVPETQDVPETQKTPNFELHFPQLSDEDELQEEIYNDDGILLSMPLMTDVYANIEYDVDYICE